MGHFLQFIRAHPCHPWSISHSGHFVRAFLRYLCFLLCKLPVSRHFTGNAQWDTFFNLSVLIRAIRGQFPTPGILCAPSSVISVSSCASFPFHAISRVMRNGTPPSIYPCSSVRSVVNFPLRAF